jgi:hypothetical protein
MPHRSFDEIQSAARAQELSVHRFDGWLAINFHSTHNPGNWLAIGKIIGNPETTPLPKI